MAIEIQTKQIRKWYGSDIARAARTGNRRALKLFGERVLARAKRRVPSPDNPSPPIVKQSPGERSPKLVQRRTTGALRDSLVSQIRKVRGENTLAVTIRSGRGHQGYRYGLDVEIGHAGRNYYSTPYMRLSFEETIPEAPEIYREFMAMEARRQRRGRPRVRVGP